MQMSGRYLDKKDKNDEDFYELESFLSSKKESSFYNEEKSRHRRIEERKSSVKKAPPLQNTYEYFLG